MNESEIRYAFFYALYEAGAYDATIEWVVPYYREMHEMMHRLAVESVSGLRQSGGTILALDIGSGTGAEAIPLLKAIPELRLLGLDLCSPMNDAFQIAATKAKVEKGHYHLVKADIVDPATTTIIQTVAAKLFGRSHFNLIISAFTLHHLDSEQKEEVFKMVYDLLEPGGIFLLGDLFNYDNESSWLTNEILNFELDWISSNFSRHAQEVDQDGQLNADHLRNLRNQWINHYTHDNNLDGITNQLEQLKRAGFSEAGNPFRYWQVGLIWARK